MSGDGKNTGVPEEPAAAALRDARNVGILIHEAESLLRAGDRDGAADVAASALAIDPVGFRTLRAHSGIMAAAGRTDEALATGLSAVDIRPDDAGARLHLGGILMGARRFREAIPHLEACIEIPGAPPAARRMLSSALRASGRVRDALDVIDAAVAHAPDDVESRMHRVSLLEARGLHGDALEELGRAAMLAPLEARIPRTASGIHETLGDMPAALALAEAALLLAPGDSSLTEHRDNMARHLGIMSAPRSPGTRAPAAPVRASVRRTPVRQGFLGQVSVRWRVVHAVMLREMRTRFARSRLGYMWAILEPLSHLLTLGSVFSILNHAPPPIGDSLFLYYLTGLLPYLMFSHVSNEVMGALAANGSVLQLPSVRRTDVLAARGILHLGTEIVVGVVAFSAAALLGEQGMPHDPLMVAEAVALLWGLAMGVGAVNLVVSEFIPSWETFYASLVRLMYFSSGIYYSPMSMPDWIRDILVWNPVLQGIELFRSGFYSQYEPHWLAPGYLAAWSLGALVLGLSLERAARRRMRIAG